MESNNLMKDKICMITGATDGIGKAAALELAKFGATIIIVGRNSDKGASTINEIQQQTKNPNIEFILADLSSQQDIRLLVNQFKKHYNHLDVLVNNVGAVFRKRQESIDGIEMTFALNHLGYFLLTYLLLDLLKNSKSARVINVASEVHKRVKLNLNDLQWNQNYNSYTVYRHSKLLNLHFTYELARRLKNTSITVNALSPGLIKTKLGIEKGGFSGQMKRFINFIAGKSPEEGAKTIIYLATSPEVKNITGKYFKNMQEVPSSEDSYDELVAKQIWKISAELTGIISE